MCAWHFQINSFSKIGSLFSHLASLFITWPIWYACADIKPGESWGSAWRRGCHGELPGQEREILVSLTHPHGLSTGGFLGFQHSGLTLTWQVLQGAFPFYPRLQFYFLKKTMIRDPITRVEQGKGEAWFAESQLQQNRVWKEGFGA